MSNAAEAGGAVAYRATANINTATTARNTVATETPSGATGLNTVGFQLLLEPLDLPE